MPKPPKDIKEDKKMLESIMIHGILKYVKNGIFPVISPNSCIDAYTIVYTLEDKGFTECEALYKYHNDTIRKFIDDCYKKIIRIPISQLVDTFIKYTEKINF